MAGFGTPVPASQFSYKAISASTLIKTGPGQCVFFKVSSSSSLTVKVWDNTSAAGTVILNTMAVDAKEEHALPAEFTTGLYFEFVAGSGALTVFYV